MKKVPRSPMVPRRMVRTPGMGMNMRGMKPRPQMPQQRMQSPLQNLEDKEITIKIAPSKNTQRPQRPRF